MKGKRLWFWVGGLALALLIAGGLFWPRPPAWSEAQIAMLRSLWIGSLEELPPDPSNRYADSEAAARLGQKFFFDPGFSGNGKVACASCHHPQYNFTDPLPRGQGMGLSQRRTMPLAGTTYSAWFFWDGRKDSLWSQALEPLEDLNEHGGTRAQYVHRVATVYREEYEAVFGALPDFSDPSRFPARAGPSGSQMERAAWERMSPEDRQQVNRVFANLGKAVAAYERKLIPGPSRFDRYVEVLLAGRAEELDGILSEDEIAGLRLFTGKAQCTRCHNGPLFTNQDFHNTGIPAATGQEPERGRSLAVERARADEFNCLGAFSDAGPDDCQELRFVSASENQTEGGFKPPSLRNVAERPPYMHAGQFTTLAEVLKHYNRAPSAQVGLSELIPLRLSARELSQLEAFLATLSGPLKTAPEWQSAPDLP